MDFNNMKYLNLISRSLLVYHIKHTIYLFIFSINLWSTQFFPFKMFDLKTQFVDFAR